MGEVTLLLAAARSGKSAAVDQLFSLLYQELRTVAHRQLRKRDHGRALNTTMIVHESYLKLRDRGALKPEDRPQFLAYAASAMRSETKASAIWAKPVFSTPTRLATGTAASV